MFFELSLTVSNPDDIDLISDLLETSGADAVTLQDSGDQPILEPQPQTTPLWENTKIIALFQQQSVLDHALPLIKTQFPEIQSTVTRLEDQDWLQNNAADFKPICFANRLWIHPSWEQPPSTALITLQLNPGLAFGTGTHPTTALCLEWLAQQNLHHKTLIDYGCGSGILAIAALKLGAQTVWAVDIDDQALIACRDNAVVNNIAESTLKITSPEKLPPLTTDILIANILAKPLIELTDVFINLLKQHGQLLLTGILINQEVAVLQHYQPFCNIEVIKRAGEWSLLYGELK